MLCPACGAESPASARFCSECGAVLDTNEATLLGDEANGLTEETLAPSASLKTPGRAAAPSSGGARSRPSSSGVLSSSSLIGGGRFVPGPVIGERCRVVALGGGAA